MPQSNDHDLLIELRTEMRGIRADIKDIKEGTTARLAALENGKQDKGEADKTQNDFEKRLRFVERYVWGAIAIIAAIQIALQYFHG